MRNRENQSSNIIVGITSGDLNGVGLETVIKVFKDRRMLDIVTPVIYADADIVKNYMEAHDISDFQYTTIKDKEEIKRKKVNVLSISDNRPEIHPGKSSKDSGKFAFESIKQSVEDLASNYIDVLVTAPIDKDSIQNEEFNFPGHTEYLANMSNVEDSLMLLCADDLRVGVITGHIPIKDVSENITTEKILSKIRLMSESLTKDFGIPTPKIALLGLNPHAGDNGLLGLEEKEIIIPAITKAKEEGFMVFGPYGSDGFFGSSSFKSFDGVLAMYHDQGLLPFKTMAFENGVNYTAGLPIVRTSPDHGTAYGIAGKNMASENSMRQAIYLACDIYQKRKEHKELTANPLEKQKKQEK